MFALRAAETSGARASRRQFLHVGALACGGLTLANVLRARAIAGQSRSNPRSVILIWLRGGPSHIDSFDLKPGAPVEIRGEFQPISTILPGVQICEYLPRMSQIMDKLVILRGIRSNDLGDHTPHYILTGFPDRGVRPVIGSVVSRLQSRREGLPPYVSMMYDPRHESETYTGVAHRAFVSSDDALEDLELHRSVAQARLDDRRQLLGDLDNLRRDMDHRGELAGVDAFRERAFNLITSRKARDAFDVDQESAETRARYGEANLNFLRARRLAEAGVSVITLKTGDWDTHEKNFSEMRWQLPILDQGIHALATDLHERGLERDVAVVVWGEFGRAPRISRGDGRDHWPDAGAAVLFGGGFRTGQVIGATDRHGGQSIGARLTPSNVLFHLYRHLGIDPTATINDAQGRPMYVLDDRDEIPGLT